jgi:hypothetical protein
MAAKASSSTQTVKEDRVRSVEATVMGHNRRWVWLSVPRESGGGLVGLTLPRRWLTHGYAQFKNLIVRIDYASLYHNGHGYQADVVIERSIDAD